MLPPFAILMPSASPIMGRPPSRKAIVSEPRLCCSCGERTTLFSISFFCPIDRVSRAACVVAGVGSAADVDDVDSCARRKSSGGRKEQRLSISAGDASDMYAVVVDVDSRSGSDVNGFSTACCGPPREPPPLLRDWRKFCTAVLASCCGADDDEESLLQVTGISKELRYRKDETAIHNHIIVAYRYMSP